MPAALPADHISSLKDIEQGYWWYVGRVQWASRLIRQQLDTREALRFADLGCGTGGFARALSEKFQFTKVALLDGDPKMLCEVGTNFEVHQVDLTKDFKLPWQPQLITCMDVMEHLEDDGAFLDRIANQLDPNGLLVMSVPALPSLTSEWDHRLGHFRRYNKRPLAQLLERHGFEITNISFMWSFMTPMGYLRKLTAKKASETEFPKVPEFVNALLKFSSSMEWFVSRIIPLPMGTSLILSAKKK